MPRNNFLKMRVSAQEREQLKALAAKQGMSLSQFLRYGALVADSLPTIPELVQKSAA